MIGPPPLRTSPGTWKLVWGGGSAGGGCSGLAFSADLAVVGDLSTSLIGGFPCRSIMTNIESS